MKRVCAVCIANCFQYSAGSVPVYVKGRNLTGVSGVQLVEHISKLLDEDDATVIEMGNAQVGWWAITTINLVELCSAHVANVVTQAGFDVRRMYPSGYSPMPTTRRGW